MLFLVTSKEPRPHGPWHTPGRHAGCLAHWVGTHMSGVAVIHPIMFVRGYAIYVETDSGRRLREILEGNPMWPDETYRIYVAAEHGAMVHRLVDVESNDQIRTLLEPLPITTFVNYEILPLGSMGGHERHIEALGLDVPFAGTGEG